MAGFTCLMKGVLWAKHFWDSLDEGELFAFEEFFRAFLTIEFFEIRFVVE